VGVEAEVYGLGPVLGVFEDGLGEEGVGFPVEYVG